MSSSIINHINYNKTTTHHGNVYYTFALHCIAFHFIPLIMFERLSCKSLMDNTGAL